MFKDPTIKIKKTIGRFFLPFVFSVISFLLLIYLTVTSYNYNSKDVEIIFELFASLLFGMVLGVFSKILDEKYNFKFNKIIFNIILIISIFFTFILTHFSNENKYVYLAIYGTVISLCVMTMYFLTSENFSKTFSYVIKNFILNLFLCGIIFVGLSF
ncbi:MAG: hypothetical protein RsTaC01_0320 [Candidatus Paraimprobicoccus trichonymphae]|uniref:Uncharacterized protein n=1 Tax=Candidatus Paraimprobicoccus trichonymphae TaxID=3033793 RepID=A0AA48HZH4_9FIRM|nr:MAG: hypothetical protein RsTaC01_0320 [Candidatus Paraimprobicoccus trichonymphae]